MKAFFIVAIVAAAFAAAEARAGVSGTGFGILEQHPIDWYDCSHKEDGNYLHPSDCTRFISCSGGIASERDCAACHVDPKRCPEGRLVYNDTVDACLWADETECRTEQPPPVPTTTREPTPTPAPVNQTTPEPLPITTEGPEDPPKEGDDCDPDRCKLSGDCQHILRCDRDTGKLVREECGVGLFYNPKDSEGNAHIHGGNCDLWDKLQQEEQDKYRGDKECLRCFWEAQGECNRTYLYQPPDLTHRNVMTLSCSEGLVFNETIETCQLCSDARRSDGSPCC